MRTVNSSEHPKQLVMVSLGPKSRSRVSPYTLGSPCLTVLGCCLLNALFCVCICLCASEHACTCVERPRGTALGLITQSLPTFFIWVRNSHRPLGSLISWVWLASKAQGSTFAIVLPSAGITSAPVFVILSFALMWMLGMISGFWPCKASGLKTEPSYRWVLAVIPEYLCFLLQLQTNVWCHVGVPLFELWTV